MLPDYIVFVARSALHTVLVMGGPLLLTALFVGLALGIIQAATSINEATLSFIPKLICVLVALLLFGNLMLEEGAILFGKVFGEIQSLNNHQL